KVECHLIITHETEYEQVICATGSSTKSPSHMRILLKNRVLFYLSEGMQIGTTDAVHIGASSQATAQTRAETFDYGVVRMFTIATVFWGVVGMGVGLLIALQLIWPQLNFEIPWLTYGRIRPVHTNLVIFAFGGSALFATPYYV